MPRVSMGRRSDQQVSVPIEYRLPVGLDIVRLNSIGQASLTSTLSTGTQIDASRISLILTSARMEIPVAPESLVTSPISASQQGGDKPIKWSQPITSSEDVIVLQQYLVSSGQDVTSNIVDQNGNQVTVYGGYLSQAEVIAMRAAAGVSQVRDQYNKANVGSSGKINYVPPIVVQKPTHGGAQE